MSPTITTSSSTNQLFHNVLQHIYSRRLLLHTHLNYQPPPAANPPATTSEPYGATENTFDANVVMVLSVLLCALICSLGLNSIIKCALRFSTLVNSHDSSFSSSSSSSSARIANTGIKKKALKTFPTFNYAAGGEEENQPGLDSECVICLSEFTSGERLRALPKCNHCFHVRCIDKWLSSHSSCPTCRQCLLQTCQKIVQANSPAAPSLPPPQTVVITIPPLEPEGIIPNYREDRV